MRPVVPTPTTHAPQIGPRLRHARQQRGFTIAQVAEATGVTKGFVSRLERDAASPSVATLVALCEVLSLEVGSLFTTPEREVISLATAPAINMGGKGVAEWLLTPRSEPRTQLLWSRADPGASGGRDLYSMNCESETVLILSGSITLVFADEEIPLRPHDTLTFRGRDAHTWRNDGEEAAEFLWILSPAPWSGSDA